ncbi:MAG: FAD-binding protein, partial [Thermomicrobium sp.]|nr:FAD-binding protein [Thermomicrobium sp.]
MDRAAIRARLVEIVGADGVLDDPDELLVYEYDASDEVFAGHHRPDFAVLPRTAEQVSAVVRLASEAGLPVVPRGA